MIKLEFNSEEEYWQFRKKHVGASDASIIMGTSRWKTNDGRIKTPYLLWQEKLGLITLDCDNSSTRYGKAMEEPARKVYESMVGDLFAPKPIKNKKYPNFMVSLDGLNISEDKAVEIKNANKEDHELAREGKVPEKYIPQVQMQIMVTNLPEIDYFSFHKDEGLIVMVRRDDEYIKILETKLNEFWYCVENLKEPDLVDDDYVEQGLQWQSYARQLYLIKKKKKELCLEEKKIEGLLKQLSGDNNSCSGPYRYTKSTYLGRVDYKSIYESLNIDFEQIDDFRSDPVTNWRLTKIK